MNHASPDRARADDAPARVPTPEQLELYVQPVVRLGDRRIVGWEALVRGSNAVGVHPMRWRGASVTGTPPGGSTVTSSQRRPAK